MKKASLSKHHNFYQFKNAPLDFKAIFTNRKLNLGFHSQPEKDIKKHRQTILKKIGLSLDDIICAQQTHGNNAYITSNRDRGRGSVKYSTAIKNTDAFITKENGLGLAIFVADCLPIFVIDKKKNVIAAIHAGWRSTQKCIAKETVLLMKKTFACNPKGMLIFFGPALRKCCFEVQKDFKKNFERSISRIKGKLYFDIIKENILQLKEAGIKETNIFDSKFCTSCDNDKFFSYRLEKDKCGRQMALITKD